jgi:hypothetical protein
MQKPSSTGSGHERCGADQLDRYRTSRSHPVQHLARPRWAPATRGGCQPVPTGVDPGLTYASWSRRVYIHQLPQTAPRLAGVIEAVFGPEAHAGRAVSAGASGGGKVEGSPRGCQQDRVLSGEACHVPAVCGSSLASLARISPIVDPIAGSWGAFLVEHGLEGPVVPALVEVGCHEVQELFGPVQASPEEVVLAGGAVEEGAEVVDGRALQLLGREPARLAVARADPHDVDPAELADLAQLDDRQDQGVPDREAEEPDQQQLLQPSDERACSGGELVPINTCRSPLLARPAGPFTDPGECAESRP